MAGVVWKEWMVGPDGRVRAGWRLLAFLVLFLAFTFVGGLLLTALGMVAADEAAITPATLFWSQAVVLVAALGAGALLLTRIEDRPAGALGFAWTAQVPRELGLGLAIGAGGLALVVGLLVLAGWVRYAPDQGTAGAYVAVLAHHFVLLAVPAAAEEALFRGYPFQVLVEGIGAVAATILASALFAAAHIYNPNVGAFALLNIFLAGVLLSVAYLRTRSLWFATAVHLGWNWAMASVLDLPVSGLEFFDTPLYDPVPAGPSWATGGAFGPEAGLAATLAALIALVAVLRVPGLGEASELRARRPIVDRRLGTQGGDVEGSTEGR